MQRNIIQAARRDPTGALKPKTHHAVLEQTGGSSRNRRQKALDRILHPKVPKPPQAFGMRV